MQHWLFLAAAIVLEVAGTTSLKLSEGLTRIWPSIFLIVFYLCSFSALAVAVKKIEVGIAYAIWSGVGTALIAVIGIAIFHESANMSKLISILLIIVGVIGLNLGNTAH